MTAFAELTNYSSLVHFHIPSLIITSFRCKSWSCKTMVNCAGQRKTLHYQLWKKTGCLLYCAWIVLLQIHLECAESLEWSAVLAFLSWKNDVTIGVLDIQSLMVLCAWLISKYSSAFASYPISLLHLMYGIHWWLKVRWSAVAIYKNYCSSFKSARSACGVWLVQPWINLSTVLKLKIYH